MRCEEKKCLRCGRVIEWRKKWENCWDEVRYCSNGCQSKKLSKKDEAVEALMRKLLEQRGKNKSICPSEPVRQLFPAESWKNEMETARMAGRRLVNEGKAEITQGGRVVDSSSAKGPVRIRLRK